MPLMKPSKSQPLVEVVSVATLKDPLGDPRAAHLPTEGPRQVKESDNGQS